RVSAGWGCCGVCAPEAGFACTGTPSACATVCGDGVQAGTETCDDGNTVSLDGCHADCRSEREREPNEDGTPSTGGTGTEGNDFDASAVARANANGALPIDWVEFGAWGVPGDE